MKKTLIFLLVAALCLPLLSACADTGTNATYAEDASVKSVTIDGTDLAEFHILYSEEDGSTVKKGAEDLAKYIKLATGLELPVTTDASAKGKRIAVTTTEEDTENYSYKSDENGVTISGGKTRGAMYGAYGFLEECLGLRFLAPDTDYVIPSEGIELNALDRTYTQYFENRNTYWACAFDNEFSVKRMQNAGQGNNRAIPEELGGSIFYTGKLCHTINDLAEVSIEGQQPCFCDEEVYQTTLKNVRKLLEENPDAKLISVSQMDKSKFCRCDECTKVIREESSYMGTVLRFVNRIAEDIKDDYPNVLIHTLAYLDTVKAPAQTVPAENVVIQYCTPEASCLYSLKTDCKTNRNVVKVLEDWGKICNRVYIWDYYADFSCFLWLFPNFNVIRDNAQFYVEHGVAGYFSEGNYKKAGGEFSELRAYLTTLVMKDPYISEEDWDKEIDTFMQGYYGAGWEKIRAFYDHMMDCLPEEDILAQALPRTLLNYDKFAANMDEMVAWFDEAESLAGDETTLGHVKMLRISLDLIRLGLIYDNEYETADEARQAEIMAELTDLTNRITAADVQYAEFLYKHNNPAPEEIVSGPFDW